MAPDRPSRRANLHSHPTKAQRHQITAPRLQKVNPSEKELQRTSSTAIWGRLASLVCRVH